MSNIDNAERDEVIENIRQINARHFREMASEKWWHMWARGAAGVAFTLAIVFFTKHFL